MPSSSLFDNPLSRRLESLVSRFDEDDRPRAMAMVVGFIAVGFGAIGDLLFCAGDHWLRSVMTSAVVAASWGAALLCLRTRAFILPLVICASTIILNFNGQYFLSGEKYFLTYLVGLPIGVLLLGGSRLGTLYLWIVIANVWLMTYFYTAWIEGSLAFVGDGSFRECVPISAAAAALLAIGRFTDSVRERLELRQAEAKDTLESERLRLRILLNSSYQGIIECSSEDEVVLLASEGVKEVIGWSSSEIRGRQFMDIVHVDSRHLVAKYFGSCEMSAEAPQEVRLQHRSGDVVWAEASGSTYIDHRGNERVVLALRNIDDQKARERQIMEAHKLKGLAEFAGGVAHDFNNLLTAISAYAELITEDAAKKGILESTSRATRLTRKILTFGRKQEVRHRVVSVNDVLRDTQPAICSLAREDTQVEFSLTDDADTVLADPDQIEQVFLNLVTNARDAMPQGGDMRIETLRHSVDDTDAQALGIASGDYVRVSVSDTGEGMDKVVLERAFEPFFSTKRNGVGTGLGLAGVYGIARHHQGAARIFSEPAQGTTVEVFFPLFRSSASPIHQTSNNEPEGLSAAIGETRGSLLLVEDEDTLRHVLVEALRTSGYEVVEASNGMEALKRLEEHGQEIGVLVTDIVMPELRGNDLAQLVRVRHPNVQILLTSGYHDDQLNLPREDVQIAFLPKPFTPSQLVRAVQELKHPKSPS